MTKKKTSKSLLPSSEDLNEKEMFHLMERLKDYFSLRDELSKREEDYNLFGGDVENIVFVIENKHKLQEAYVKCAELLWSADSKVNDRFEDDGEKFCESTSNWCYEQALPNR
jgi:hypothetical protein